MALRDDILGKDDLPRESVDVPEWGCAVFIRTMTGRERDAFEGEIVAGQLHQNMRARLVVRTAVDAEGVRVFQDADAEALGNKSAKALDRLFPVAMRLNGLSESDVDELEGN